jgi:hypothetical protein
MSLDLFRRHRRLLGWSLLLALLLFVFGTFYGWRYGFRSLPQAPPGFQLQATVSPAWDELTTNSFWYWFRELDSPTLPENLLNLTCIAAMEDWAALLHAEVSSSWPAFLHAEVSGALLQKWVRSPELALLPRLLQAASVSPDARRPKPALRSEHSCLVVALGYPLLLAGDALFAGDAAAAYDTLLLSWGLQARLTPVSEFADLFDEREVEQVNVALARPWRWLSLSGPEISRERAVGVLRRLDDVAGQVVPFKIAYAESVKQQLLTARSLRQPHWRRVKILWLQASNLMVRDVVSIFGWTYSLLRGERFVRLDISGIRHLGRPVSELILALQNVAARPEDFEQMEEAFFHAALRLGGELDGQPAVRLGSGGESSLSWWARWVRRFDRPAIWRCPNHLPNPEVIKRSYDWWRVYLDSCRLTLALRTYRNEHGTWPEQLEQMVPGILDRIPLDPFSGQPYHYQRQAGEWVFWSEGSQRNTLSPGKHGELPQRSFWSVEERNPPFQLVPTPR